MRKLATVRIIDDIQPIEGADKIEVATVGGWKVVVKKDEFKVGDSALYFEIDSWIPIELAPFLCKGKEPREFNGVKGERLRSIKLKKQISQGLLLKVKDVFDIISLENKEYINISDSKQLEYEDTNANISNIEHNNRKIICGEI